MPESSIKSSELGACGIDLAPLIQKIAVGDAVALASLYDETCGFIFGVILRILENGTIAEETLLDVYTKVWRHAGTFDRETGETFAWLVRLARSQAIGREREQSPEASPEAPGYAAGGQEPPAYLRDLLAVRVEREAQIPVPAPPPVPKDAELKHAAPAPPRFPAPARRRPVLPWLMVLIFAALAAAAGYEWLQTEKFLDHSIQRQEGLAIEAQKEQERLRSQLEEYRAKTRELDQIDAILANSGSRTVELAPQAVSLGLSLAAFLDEANNRCIVTGHLKPAPEASNYQIWFVEASVRVSAGLLEPDINGHAFKALDIDPGVQKILAIMITIEPRGGSEQPTTPALGLGRIS